MQDGTRAIAAPLPSDIEIFDKKTSWVIHCSLKGNIFYKSYTKQRPNCKLSTSVWVLITPLIALVFWLQSKLKESCIRQTVLLEFYVHTD